MAGSHCAAADSPFVGEGGARDAEHAARACASERHAYPCSARRHPVAHGPPQPVALEPRCRAENPPDDPRPDEAAHGCAQHLRSPPAAHSRLAGPRHPCPTGSGQATRAAPGLRLHRSRGRYPAPGGTRGGGAGARGRGAGRSTRGPAAYLVDAARKLADLLGVDLLLRHHLRLLRQQPRPGGRRRHSQARLDAAEPLLRADFDPAREARGMQPRPQQRRVSRRPAGRGARPRRPPNRQHRPERPLPPHGRHSRGVLSGLI